jgi:hypothetical protein
MAEIGCTKVNRRLKTGSIICDKICDIVALATLVTNVTDVTDQFMD